MYFVKTEGDSKLHDATGLDDGRRATYIIPNNVTPLFFMESTAFANMNLNIDLIVLSASMYLGAAW